MAPSWWPGLRPLFRRPKPWRRMTPPAASGLTISLSIAGIGWKDMPSEVSRAGAISDREPTAQELKRQLAEARDQQNATREILDVMALSPSNAQPVFDAIARSAQAVRWF